MLPITDKKWKIFIVSHKYVYKKMYISDEYFNNSNYVIADVNMELNNQIINETDLSIVSQRNFKNFISLGKEYAESEIIYNIWKNGLYNDLDYIGFTHYDCEFPDGISFTKEVSEFIKDKNKSHISFLTFSSEKEWHKWNKKANYMKLKNGTKVSEYQYILDDYNKYHQTRYTKRDIIEKKYINLCSNFLIDVETFDKMMTFFDWVIKNNRISNIDNSIDKRLPGGMAERYFGVFLMFENLKFKDIPISHVGATTKETCRIPRAKSIFKKINIFLKNIKNELIH